MDIVEHYFSFTCECAACRSKQPKSATKDDLKFYQQIADNFWKGRDVKSLRAEVETLRQLLRRGVKQVSAWQNKYGEHTPQWLPPAGDVRWVEDVEDALKGGE